VTITTTVAGDTGRLTFSGSAGQRVSLMSSGSGFSPSGGSAYVSIEKPVGTTLSGGWPYHYVTNSRVDFIDRVTLPVTGTYSVIFDPSGTDTGSGTFTLYAVPADVDDPIAISGPPVTVTLGTPGQDASLPFTGAAGQTVRLDRYGISIPTSIVKILQEDGTVVASSGAVGTPDNYFDATLPVTGSYSVLVDGYQHYTGSMTLQLSVTGDAPYDGADVSVCGTVPVLRAQPVTGATQYQFQVASDSSFSSVVSDSGLQPTTNTFAPPAGALTAGGTYYWRWKTATVGWSSGRSFTTGVPKLGERESMWSVGPLSVNLVNGNLVVGLPGPSYPTATGSMGVSASYNLLETRNRGLGAGWLLDAGAAGAGAPLLLLDHNLLVGGERLDAVEAIYEDGGSTCFTHVGETNTYVAAPGDGQLLSKNADGGWTLVSGDTIASFTVANGSTGVASLAAVETAGAAAGNGKLTYAYSVADPSKIASVTDGAGRSLMFTWSSLNPAGCAAAIVCVTGPDGVTWQYVGDSGGGTGGKLVRVNNGTRDLAEVGYDGSARVNKLRNANDLNPSAASPGYDTTHALTIAYDAGKVASVSDGPITGQSPSTSTWSFTYSPGSVSTSATRAAHDGLTLGTVRTAAGFTTVTPPRQQGQSSPKSTKTYYDTLGHPIEVVDLLGNRVLAHYNARGQLLWTEDEDGNPTDYSWDTHDDVLVSTTGPDSDGAGPLARPVVTNRYDETTIGTSTTAGAALTGLQGSYYANPNLAGRPAKRQNDAQIDFDWGSGGPAALGGQSDNFSARWVGNLAVPTIGVYTFSTIADNGTRVTLAGFQAIDNWKTQSVVTSSSTGITLTPGLHKIVVESFHATGSAELELRWSCSGCSPAISTAAIPTSALRPAWLNQTSTVSPLGRVSLQHYADPASAQPDYALARLNDGTNLITSFTYDSYGRVTRKVMPKGNGGRTIDANGNLGGSPNLDFATDWVYYGATETAAPPSACGGGTAVNQGELLKSVTPHGIATTTTVYDTAGQPVASTNGKGTTCSSYSSEGRLASAIAPGDSQATTYTYDPAGQTRTVTNAAGTVTSEYDEAGRVKRSLDSFGAEATFAYDSESNLTSRTAATGALASSTNYTTSYAYDDAGWLSSLTDPASRVYGFYYDARGNLKATQYPNGTFSWTDYNAAGALTGLYNRHGTLSTPLPSSVPSDASPLVDFAYSHDLEGRKTEEVRSGGGLTTETSGYSYDELGRLKTVSLPSGVSRTYNFDLDSNRTSVVENSSTVASYTYDPSTTAGVDQLTSVTEGGNTRSFTYNTDGEVTAYGTKSLSWDGWGRHTGGTFAGTSVSYEFDPVGFRRKRTSGTTVTRYLHGGLLETDNTGTLTLTDIDGPAGDLAHYAGAPTTGSTVSFLYYNGHGDLAANADPGGNRTSAHSYDPFGTPLQTLPSNATSEGWTGRWDKKHDSASDLVEMGARIYDPGLGRFLAVDPIEDGSCNSYEFACQDPVNHYDLDGLRCRTCPERGKGVNSFSRIQAARALGRFRISIGRHPRVEAQNDPKYHYFSPRKVRQVVRDGVLTKRDKGYHRYTLPGAQGFYEVGGFWVGKGRSLRFHVTHRFIDRRAQ
jgi:RHS repeat-associated protein